MREEAIVRALRQPPGCFQVAAIDAALTAIDEAPADAEPASCAMVRDDGRSVRLVLFAETGTVAAVDLDG
jgi:hypothetical protein